MNRFLLLLLCSFTTVTFVQAQSLSISADSASPNTMWIEATTDVLVHVSNTDTVNAATGISLVVGRQSGTLVLLDTVQTNFVLAPATDTLLPVPVQFTTANGFVPGGNIVVIWPEAPGANTIDTLFQQVFGGQPDSLGAFVANGAYYEPVVWQTFSKYSYVLRNTGTTTFDIAVDLRFAVEGPGIFTEIDSLFGISLPSLASGNEYSGFHFLTYSKIAGVPGGNTIVIWPEAPDNPTVFITDSARVNYLLAPVGVDHSEELKNLLLFPNPAYDITRLHLNGQRITAQSIRVVDANGRLVQQLANTGEVDLSSLNSGIYFVEIELTTGETKSFKAIRF